MKTIFLFIISSILCYGQCTNCNDFPPDKRICWGDKKIEAQENYARFADAHFSKLYVTSLQERAEIFRLMDWLLENAPCLHFNIYKDYKEVIEELLKTDLSRKDKKKLQAKLRTVDELKKKHYG